MATAWDCSCFLLAFSCSALLGHWWAVVVPVLVWLGIALFLFLNNGWYGGGWGDLGIELNVLAALLSVAGAVVGVVARDITASARMADRG
jgi:hypothetical protein